MLFWPEHPDRINGKWKPADKNWSGRSCACVFVNSICYLYKWPNEWPTGRADLARTNAKIVDLSSNVSHVCTYTYGVPWDPRLISSRKNFSCAKWRRNGSYVLLQPKLQIKTTRRPVRVRALHVRASLAARGISDVRNDRLRRAADASQTIFVRASVCTRCISAFASNMKFRNNKIRNSTKS
jgi:hypothetical protein